MSGSECTLKPNKKLTIRPNKRNIIFVIDRIKPPLLAVACYEKHNTRTKQYNINNNSINNKRLTAMCRRDICRNNKRRNVSSERTTIRSLRRSCNFGDLVAVYFIFIKKKKIIIYQTARAVFVFNSIV